MHFTYFLLVATATLLSGCNASGTVSGDTQTKLSTMTSTDAAVPARGDVKRFLRAYHEVDGDEKDEEERVNPANLDEEALATWTAKWAARADEWFDKKRTPSQIKDKLTGLNGEMSRKNGRKYYLFLKRWNEEHPRS
ncbi:Secreted RxLR effector peptide protein [Phytophthora palmivora]|uniref:RxLR effector protein n=1 Tax=Phytophthora palmivora TaxID=4796 RepID=A0A2P4Y9Y1_9STRA|nr:Secreted RxLR effector peptide protein [Phytophthora palmivora]